MGLWDKEVDNSFDSLFDMNRDDVLDPAEQALQFEFLEEQLKKQMPVIDDEDSYNSGGFDGDFDDYDDGYFNDDC